MLLLHCSPWASELMELSMNGLTNMGTMTQKLQDLPVKDRDSHVCALFMIRIETNTRSERKRAGILLSCLLRTKVDSLSRSWSPDTVFLHKQRWKLLNLFTVTWAIAHQHFKNISQSAVCPETHKNILGTGQKVTPVPPRQPSVGQSSLHSV